jgi:hypothetical protein
MPRLQSENVGAADRSWLGSTHAIANARTETIDISTFTPSTHYPNGYIPSGTPVAIVSGLLVPYDVTIGTTTGAGILAGHLLNDEKVVGSTDFGVALFDHGRVKSAKVPYASFVTPIAAKNGSNILYV